MIAETTQQKLQSATNATLRAHAITDEAKAFVTVLSGMADEYALAKGLRKHKRGKTFSKLEYATGAFLANLLRARLPEISSDWVYRSMNRGSFTGAKVSYATFKELTDCLIGLALIEKIAGHKVSDEPGDTGKFGARFRATPALIRLSTEYGVEPSKTLSHFKFEYELPKEPIELRARKIVSFYSRSSPIGKPMKVEKTSETARLQSEVQELNEYFAQQSLLGGEHDGYVRIFHNGDDPFFNWNLGGRLYSQHFTQSYQVLSGDTRAAMTINGEDVAEIDLRASYLTIFLSLHGVELAAGSDPYELKGLGENKRSAVKSWMVATFGNSKPIRRWPPEMLKDHPELADHPVKEITEAALSQYPALKAWGHPLDGHIHGWADLMWLESVVMVSTMLDLKREFAVPSLSVHDSLIVPASKAEQAALRLARRFHGVTRVRPLLKIKQPPQNLANRTHL